MAEYIAKERVIQEIKGMDNCGCITRSVNHVCEDIRSIPTADVIPIPKGATNGDAVKAMFDIPDNEIDEGLSTTYIYTNKRVLKGGSQDYLREQITFCRDWWNAPYKSGSEGK